jgi:hypothetical protein
MAKKRDLISKKKILQKDNDLRKKTDKTSLKGNNLDNFKFVLKKGLKKRNFKEKLKKIIKKIKFPEFKAEKVQKKEDEIKEPAKEIEEKPLIKSSKHTKVYETQLDKLLFFVNKNGRITETNVIKEFHITKDIADQWGKILSENGFIDFYIPIFGDPEFRKKGVKFERKKISKLIKEKAKSIFHNNPNLKIIVPAASIVLLLIFSGAFIIFKELTFKEEVKINITEQINESVIELIPFEGPGVKAAMAFSGNGSYDCRSSDGALRYAIQNSFVKIEKLDGTSKVIIKNNKTYTLNVGTGAWKESEIREGLAIPGSGNYPRINMECKEINLTEKEFNT